VSPTSLTFRYDGTCAPGYVIEKVPLGVRGTSPAVGIFKGRSVTSAEGYSSMDFEIDTPQEEVVKAEFQTTIGCGGLCAVYAERDANGTIDCLQKPPSSVSLNLTFGGRRTSYTTDVCILSPGGYIDYHTKSVDITADFKQVVASSPAKIPLRLEMTDAYGMGTNPGALMYISVCRQASP
jgi:hypothetical protein